jgi:benzoyl-CoA reductase/2-hydroxyglutaryl-CoA dehydratase subunit BcrC/BadD/HgdB
MKINISQRISDALFNTSKANGNNLNKTETLFRAYRVAAKVNTLNPQIPRSDRLYLSQAVDYYARVLRARRKKQFIAAYSLSFPVEILYAMDIVPFQLEATGWLLAMLTGETNQLLTAANEVGLASEICSVHRLMAGAYARQVFPRPNAVLWTNIPCENSAKSGALLAKLNRCPGFLLDFPYRDSTAEVEYLVGEFQNLIAFLEKESGHKFDAGKLAQAITRSNEQIALCREIAQLRKNVPSPFPSFTFLRVLMANLLWGGQAEATVYLKALRDELIAKPLKRTGMVTSERFRLINLSLPPLYFVGSLKNIFEEYGVVEVVNPFFLNWPEGLLDASQPLPALARKAFMNPVMAICGEVSRSRLDTLQQYVSDYKIDGSINYAHIGCGSFGGASRLVRDTLKDAGIPMLDLSCDITDPTIASPEDMREQLVRFFELLEDR